MFSSIRSVSRVAARVGARVATPVVRLSTSAARTTTSTSTTTLRVARAVGVFGAAFGAAAYLSSATSPVSASAAPAATSTAASPSGLNPKEFVPLRVRDVSNYNYNTKIVVLELASPDAELGAPVASFVMAKGSPDAEGKPTARPYTPISTSVRGELHLLVKVYEQGVVSKHIDHLKAGDSLEIKGPIPKMRFTPNLKKKIGMIAGGTGITPMLQVAEALLEDPEDRTELSLVFANNEERDILLRERLDALVAKYPSRLRVHHVLVTPPATGTWTGSVGFVNRAIVEKFMPAPSDDSLILVCGPPPMVSAVSGSKAPDYSQGEVGGVLKELNYTSSQVFKF